MRQKKLIPFIAFSLILFVAPFIHSESHYKYVKSPEYVNSPSSDVYFGHVSFADVKYDGKDPVVIRVGETSPEVAVVNLPLAPGDTVRTTDSRRCEIQFDTGTIIRLDRNTELKIETIMAASLSSRRKITNLVLNKGQIYIMYKRYNSREVFQMITPNAAVKMKHNTVALINAREDGLTDVQVKEGNAYILYGPDEYSIQEKKIKKLQKLTVSLDHQALLDEYQPDVDFELWNENMNENFIVMHREKSFIPQPVQKLSPAVFYFAQKYSNLHGEWVWNSLYGYVWRPFYNDYYPWGNWQPYLYGKWRDINSQLFWVPEETWGWVPYHLGLWVWDEKLGWLWIPGSAFAPAWAAWDFYGGYYSWRPWSMYDWHYASMGYYPSGSGYYDYYRWRYYDYDRPEGEREVRRVIRKDQLKKGKSISSKMPKELKRVYNNVLSALKKGDKRLLPSLRNIPEHLIAVKKEDLNASKIQEKVAKLGEISSKEQKALPAQKSMKDPYTEAVRTFKRNNIVASLKEKVRMSLIQERRSERTFPNKTGHLEAIRKAIDSKVIESKGKVTSPGKKGALRSGDKRFLSAPKPIRTHSSMRFRDWNPDVRVASRAGVTIRYSSKSNEVRCPELRISSRTVVSRSGHFRGGLSSSGGGGGSSSGSGGSSGSSSSSKGSGGGGSHSAGSKGGGGVKK